MIKGIIFDFDGTLFDSMTIWNTVGDVYLSSIGKEPKENLQEMLKSLSLLQAAEYIREEYKLPFSDREIMDGINRVVEESYFKEVMPREGVIPFLQELKRRDIRMCIATATDRYMIEAALKRCNMEHFFCEILTCSEVGSGKDRPDIFIKAMEVLKTDLESTVIFEDAYHAVCTAKDNGFKVVVLRDGHESRQQELAEMADVYLPDYSELNNFWKFASAV